VRARDLLLAALLLALGGLAVVDALRDAGPSAPAPRAVASTAQTTTEEIPERFPRVPARGRLLFLDENGCRIHEVQVSTGEALSVPPLETGCEVWSAAHGERIAYALPAPFARLRPFRFFDLTNPLRDLGAFETVEDVLFAPDGLTGAWCESDEAGFVLELGDAEPRRLPRCPAAFTPEGELAYLEPEGVRAGGRLVVRTRRPATRVHWGTGGSLVLLYRNRIERYEGDRLAKRMRLPAPARDRPPTFSPDTCIAVFPAAGSLDLLVLDLCGPGGELGRVPARAVAFSPDGAWGALATDSGIQLFPLQGGDDGQTTLWPVRANALAWLG
jgi:hypothetical protein